MNAYCCYRSIVTIARIAGDAARRVLGLKTGQSHLTPQLADKLDAYGKNYNIPRQIERLRNCSHDGATGYSFAVWGDVRDHCSVFTKLWKAINEEDIRFSILTGDLVRHGWAKEWLRDFLPIIDRYAKVPLFPAIGNHDTGSDGQEYERLFVLRDYHFDFGNDRFIILDTTKGYASKTQLDWLERLLSTVQGHAFVFAHMPPGVIAKWSYYSFFQNAEAFCELLARYAVRQAFFSHIHAYSTASYKGVGLTVSGGGGSQLHRRFGPLGNVYHYVLVHVQGDSVIQEVVRLQHGHLVRGPAGNDYCRYPDGKPPIRLFHARRKPGIPPADSRRTG